MLTRLLSLAIVASVVLACAPGKHRAGGNETTAVAATSAPATTPRVAESVDIRQGPEGWIFLEADGVDTAAAGFHDRISGAFVWYEAGLTLPITPLTESRSRLTGASASEEQTNGVAYTMVTLPAKTRRNSSGRPCKEIAATFRYSHPDASGHQTSFNFWTVACTDEQRDRAMALILGKALATRGGAFQGDWLKDARHVNRKETAALAIGTPWKEVRVKLGPSIAVADAPANGFMISYELRQPRSAQGAAFTTLVFDQEQRFVEKRPGMVTRDRDRLPGPLVAR